MNKITLIITLFLINTFSIMAQKISSEFPFESQYIDILGSKMHYIEEYADKEIS